MTAPAARRWLRPRNVVIVVLAAAFLWAAREVWWFATANFAPHVDYANRLQTLCESHQPPGRDGWEAACAAASLMIEIADEFKELFPDVERSGDMLNPLDFDAVYTGAFDLALYDRELRALEMMRERGGIDLLAEAAACPRAVRPISSEPPLLLNVMLPELAHFRMLAKTRLASMRIAAEAGDREERVAAFEHALAIARISGSQTFLIDRLVGIAILQMALRELQQEIAERPLDEATALGMLEALDRQAVFPPMSLPYESERCSTLDVIQYAFSDDGHGDGRIVLARFDEIQSAWGTAGPRSGTVIDRMGALFLAGRAETTALTNEFYDGVTENTRLDPVARTKQGFDENAFMAKLTTRHFLLNTLIPAVSRAMWNDDNAMAALAATRVMLGIEIFRARHGRLPADLAELAADVFPPPDALPVDPTHGGPFVYRIVDDASNDWPYLLYSTGVDQTDDISAAGKDYEDAISPRGRVIDADVDVLFNRKRPERDQ